MQTNEWQDENDLEMAWFKLKLKENKRLWFETYMRVRNNWDWTETVVSWYSEYLNMLNWYR